MRPIEAAPRRQLAAVGSACLIGSASVGTLLIPGWRPTSLAGSVTFGTTCLLLGCLTSLLLVGSRSVSGGSGLTPFRLGSWYVLALAIGFALPSYAWRAPQPGKSEQILISSVVPALYLVLLALVCWTAGYMVGAPEPLRNAARRALQRSAGGTLPVFRSPSLPLYFFAVGLVGNGLSLFTGRFGYLGDPAALINSPSPFTQLFGAMSQFLTFGLVLATIDLVGSGMRKGRALVAFMMTTVIAFGLLAGHKSDFLLALLGPLIVFGVAKPSWARRGLLLGALTFLFVAQFIQTYRTVVRNDSGSLTARGALSTVPAVLSASVFSRQPGDVVASSATDLSGRLREIDNVAIVIQKTPSAIPFVGPIPLLSAPILGLVPRLVWPDKPVLATGYDFNQRYYGAPASVRTSSAITSVGDLYRHGGRLAVVIGMIVLGMVIRTVDDIAHPSLNLRFALIYMTLFVHLVDIESGVASLIAGLPKVLLVAFVATYIAFRRDGAASRASG